MMNRAKKKLEAFWPRKDYVIKLICLATQLSELGNSYIKEEEGNVKCAVFHRILSLFQYMQLLYSFLVFFLVDSNPSSRSEMFPAPCILFLELFVYPLSKNPLVTCSPPSAISCVAFSFLFNERLFPLYLQTFPPPLISSLYHVCSLLHSSLCALVLLVLRSVSVFFVSVTITLFQSP